MTQFTYKSASADNKLCVCVVVSVSVLHHVKDVEYVSLVLQSWTLFQLPHQRCKVRVALRVSRQVQISSTMGLVRDVGVRQIHFGATLKSQEKQRKDLLCLPCAALHVGHAEDEELQVG